MSPIYLFKYLPFVIIEQASQIESAFGYFIEKFPSHLAVIFTRTRDIYEHFLYEHFLQLETEIRLRDLRYRIRARTGERQHGLKVPEMH